MNGVPDDLSDKCDVTNLESIKEYVIPRLLKKKVAVITTTPDGRTILHNVKPQVEISRKFCPDVRRTSSYPDINKYSGDASETELKLQKQCIVNTELKRLLIASVGDALANRLEKLAKEKAQLNEQVNILTRQTAGDAEKIENLAIQGDIWKSKFLAARVVVNELTLWKDSVTNKLHESQQSLQKFEAHRKKICHTLHIADGTLTNAVVDLSCHTKQDEAVMKKLKEASKCIAELLTIHATDMCSLEQQWDDLPSEPACTPNMYTDNTYYDYSEIPDRLCDDSCCSHTPLSDSSDPLATPPRTCSKAPKEQPPIKSCKGEVVARKYESCKKSMFVGGCKSCAEREILHL